MYQLALALLMIFGAWGAWRRNPLYSPRASLRSVSIILLAIAGAVGVIIGTVELTATRAPAIFGCALAAAILFDTLALIFIIQAVTVPPASKPAALPRSVHLVTTNRRKTYRWLQVFGILVAVFVLGGLLRGPTRIISLTFGGLTLLLAVILLPVYYYNTRELDRALTATEINPWVHWHYTPEQWRQWSEVQAGRLRAAPPAFVLRRDWRRFLLPFAIIIGGVALISPGSWPFKSIYLAVICATIFGVAVFSGFGRARSADRLLTKLLEASPDAWFGRDGLFCDGVFTPWINVSIYLLSAKIDERQPRSLVFDFERSVPNPYGSSQVIAIHQSVLIPADAGADLARLQRELSSRCPKARIALA